LDGAIHPNLGYLGAGHHHKALTNWHLNRLPSSLQGLNLSSPPLGRSSLNNPLLDKGIQSCCIVRMPTPWIHQVHPLNHHLRDSKARILGRELLSAVFSSSHIEGFEGVWILGQELLLAVLPSLHISNSRRWLLRASLGSLSITHRGIRRRVWILGPRASLGHPSIIAHQQLEGWAESFSLGSPSFAHRQF
jgi:hypothetical protein